MNWWESAPLASDAPQSAPQGQSGGDWWKSAPLASDAVPAASSRDAKGFLSGLRQNVSDGLEGTADAYGKIATGPQNFGTRTAANALLGFGADVIRQPVKTLVMDPINAVKGIPGNTADTASALGRGEFKEAGQSALKAGGGLMELAAVVPAGRGVKQGVGELAKGLRGGATPSPAAAVSPDASLYSTLDRMAKGDGVDLASALEKVKAGNSDSMLFQDLGLADTAAGLGNRAGPSRDVMGEAAKRYMSSQRNRVQGAIGDTLGNPDFDGTMAKLVEGQKAKAGPLYEKAMATPFDPTTPEAQAALRSPAFRAAMGKTLKELASLGQNPNQMELLHRTQRALQGRVGRETRAGDDYAAGLANDLKRMGQGAIEASSSEYAEGRKLFAGSKAAERAAEQGGKFFTTGERPWAEGVAAMNPSEREAALVGVMDAVNRKLDLPDSYKALRADVMKPSFERKLAAIVGPDKAASLAATLRREAELGEIAQRARAGQGSKTTPTAEAIQNVEAAAQSGVKGRGIRGARYFFKNGLDVNRYVRDAGDKVLAFAGDVPEKQMTELAELLTMPTEAGVARLKGMRPEQLDQMDAALSGMGNSPQVQGLRSAVAEMRRGAGQSAKLGLLGAAAYNAGSPIP